nr:M90 family metallopeptidase [Neosynechococcus sphagnicola]
MIERNLTIYSYLSPTQKRQLQEHIQVFLREKQFLGCLGLKITEEMKVTIAAIACLLLLNNQGKYFSKLRSILVYPSTYVVTETAIDENRIVEQKRTARLGESWAKDQLILSWQQVQQDIRNWKDGHNVVIHEFVHQLDQEEGRVQGVPILPKNLDYTLWKQVMTEAYLSHCDDVERGVKTLIDAYGAINPAEFFAVTTETFF